MEHYVAYHNAKKMGYPLESSDDLNFLSRKLGHLKKAIRNTVWVVEGKAEGKNTTFFLHGAYIANHVDTKAIPYVISGSCVKEFSPPVQLNDLSWFPALKKSQGNFSLGFNRISDASVVQALIALQTESDPPPFLSPLPDVDLLTASEGTAHLRTHLYRERNRGIVEKKKNATLKATGRLVCEVCGFDFSVTYGTYGEGFCEVHHLMPLSEKGSSTTKLNDLAILCSNCHRIIHRSMLSVTELSKVVNHRP